MAVYGGTQEAGVPSSEYINKKERGIL